MPKGAGAQKRKKRGSGDAGTSSSPSVNLRPRGPPPPLVYYGDDIEMSDRVESSDDDVEDPSLNFELSWRNRGVAGGGNDSDDDSAEEEDEEEEQQGGQQQQLGRPYIREPNYPSYRGPIDYYQAGMADTVVTVGENGLRKFCPRPARLTFSAHVRLWLHEGVFAVVV
jgi:hypothetical protein